MTQGFHIFYPLIVTFNVMEHLWSFSYHLAATDTISSPASYFYLFYFFYFNNTKEMHLVMLPRKHKVFQPEGMCQKM